ncbi:MAG: tetratricopeptide repeat protein [Lentisphaerae bacterium]|nr:tetratricopeptide repeat protein [Lentisphaerota bacterium]
MRSRETMPRRHRRIMRLALCAAALCACGLADAADEVIGATDRRLLADALFTRGMHEQAMQEYAALAAIPALEERDVVLFRLGESCRRLNRNADAEHAYARLVKEFPKTAFRAPAQIQRALLAAGETRFTDAAALLTPFVEDAAVPADLAPVVLQTLADILERGGDAAGALARYDQIRTRFPDSEFAAPAAIRQAYALAQSAKPADLARAIELYREAAARAQTPRVAAEALFQLGQSLASANPPKAAAAFAELRENHPEDLRTRDAAQTAAWACHDAAQFEAALAWIPADGGLPDERESFQYIRANGARQLGRLDDAIEAYQAFVRDYPKSPRLQRVRYETLLTLARAGRHADVLAAATGFDPGTEWAADVLWLQAESAAALRKNDLSVAFYTKVTESHPKHALAGDAWIRMGWLHHDHQAWRQAATAFTQAVTRYPAHPQAAQTLYAAGVCLSRAGESEDALARWRKLLVNYPSYDSPDEVCFQIAMELLRLKRDADALPALDRLITRHAASQRAGEALYWRGVLRQRQSDGADGAIADFRAAIKTGLPDERLRDARLALGALLLQRQGAEEAATVFQPLLDASTRDALPPDHLAWLAEFHYSRGAFAEAELAARTLAGGNHGLPWTQTGWALLGRALRAQKRAPDAIDAYTRAAAVTADTPHLPETLLRLGELLVDAGRLDEADTRLREAVAKTSAPEWQGLRAHAYAGLGRCAEARDQKELALRYYLSIALLYDDPVLVPAALDKAASLHAALGHPAESEATGRELLERYPESAQANVWKARRSANPEKGKDHP